MRHVTSLFIFLVLTGMALSTVVHAQVTCQTNGNTTNCNGSLGGSTIHDNGAFNSNLANISAAQFGPNAVALQQQAAAQAQLANQQARLVAQQTEYLRLQTEALKRQQAQLDTEAQAERDRANAELLAQQRARAAAVVVAGKISAERHSAAAAAAGISTERYTAAQARCRAVSGDDEPLCNELDANDVIRSEAVAAKQVR